MVLGTFRPAYLPDLNFFWQMAQCDAVIFTDHLNFSKGSAINRSALFPDAQTRLTIPVHHNTKRKHIFETSIDYHDHWPEKHLRTFHHFFHNLPYAYYYLPQLEELFNSPFQSLGDFLYQLQHKIVHWLYLPVNLLRSSETEYNDTPENLIQNWCAQTHSNLYIGTPQTFENQWIHKKRLEEKGIATATFVPLPPSHLLKNYQSVVILHFLLQFGPEAGFILQQYLPPKPRHTLNGHALNG